MWRLAGEPERDPDKSIGEEAKGSAGTVATGMRLGEPIFGVWGAGVLVEWAIIALKRSPSFPCLCGSIVPSEFLLNESIDPRS